jgi:hypothetical protein
MTLILAALAGTGNAAAGETMTPLERVAARQTVELRHRPVSPYTASVSLLEESGRLLTMIS